MNHNTIFVGMIAFLVVISTAGDGGTHQHRSPSGQNAVPLVSNVVATVDTVKDIVTITYDVADAENDPLMISLRVSADSGLTFLFPVDSVSGDVGYPVSPGTGKQIHWYYNPATLTPPASGSFRAKVIADDVQPVDVQGIVDEVDSNRIMNDMTFMVGVRHRTAGAQHLEEVKDTIEQRFASDGLQVGRHTFVYQSYTAANMLGRHPGLIDEEKTVIVDGHFDTVPTSPGADDNASGTVGMLEAMRVLSRYNFRHTLKFIGFDLEESGLVGSFRYVADAIPPHENIIGVLNHEMIGFFSSDSGSQSVPSGFCTLFPEGCDSLAATGYRGNFISNIANVNSNSLRMLFDSSARAYVPQLRVLSLAVPGNGQIAPDLRRSDHAPFWDAGYKALMLTDGANFRNPNYHLSSDTLGTINFTFMTNVIKATVATAATLAGVIHGSAGVSNFFDVNITSIPQASSTAPERYSLEQNYPNPFNPSTTIQYELPQRAFVAIIVYNLLGQEVATLVNEEQPAGSYQVQFDGSDLASGLYFYRLQAEDFVDTKKLLLLK